MINQMQYFNSKAANIQSPELLQHQVTDEQEDALDNADVASGFRQLISENVQALLPKIREEMLQIISTVAVKTQE